MSTFFRDHIVWDNLYPATPTNGSRFQHHDYLRRMQEKGVACISISVAVDPDSLTSAVKRIAEWRGFIHENADRFRLVERAADVAAAHAQGQLGIAFHFQGTLPFERDLPLVEMFYRLGVRQALLAYNQRNHVGDGCHEPENAGLSRFGRALVAEMNRVGMLIDCTHTGYRTAADAIEASSAPVIMSHSNARALRDHERNIPDDLARRIAGSGGVIGVNGVSLFLGARGEDLAEAAFRHIDHFVSLLGIEHVGLGLDATPDEALTNRTVAAQSGKYPAGMGYCDGISFLDTAATAALAERMLQAGWRDADIAAVAGGNWQRVAAKVWR